MTSIHLTENDALIIIDFQNDFLPGGALAVSGGSDILPVLNGYIARLHRPGVSVYATRDWYPADHCSFWSQGGIWPPHCVADTPGAQFSASLRLSESTVIVSKATT